jgi:voltage-gated potassium channel
VRDRFNAFVQSHEVAWELAMGFLAVIYVAVGFAQDDPSNPGASVLFPIETALTVLFIAEFASRLLASRDRGRYLRGHWIDVLALLPVARGLRIARLFRVLRLTRFFAGTYRAAIRAERMRGAEGIALVVVGWSAVTIICCLALYAIEADTNPSLGSPLDALWWGITTLSTVGYGDVTPVTPEGRLVAGALMVLGIGLFGAITAITTNTLIAKTSGSQAVDGVGDLERIAVLFDRGALSSDEFAAAKTRVLARL